MLNVPFAIADATALTEAGYVGEDVENILLKLIQAADYDVKKAETGIIYIDEIDKIARKSENPSITRDVSRRGRAAGAAEDPRGHAGQRAAPGRAQAPAPGVHPDRHHERAVHLRRRVRRASTRSSRAASVARASASAPRCVSRDEKDIGELFAQVLPEDLLKFGLIPEFVGRLPVITSVDNLDEDALVDILTKPKNALVRQYQRFFEFDGVELEFKDDALRAISEQAIMRGTGARGLRAIMEEVLLNVMYELPSREDVTKCLVDKDVVLTGVNPTLVPHAEAVEEAQRAPREDRLTVRRRHRRAPRVRSPLRRSRRAGQSTASSFSSNSARTASASASFSVPSSSRPLLTSSDASKSMSVTTSWTAIERGPKLPD